MGKSTLTFLALQILQPVLVLRWGRLEHWVIAAGVGLSSMFTTQLVMMPGMQVLDGGTPRSDSGCQPSSGSDIILSEEKIDANELVRANINAVERRRALVMRSWSRRGTLQL
jgi:hypothetical protein